MDQASDYQLIENRVQKKCEVPSEGYNQQNPGSGKLFRTNNPVS